MTWAEVALLTEQVGNVINAALQQRDEQIADLKRQVAELAGRPLLKWAGVYRTEVPYVEGPRW